MIKDSVSTKIRLRRVRDEIGVRIPLNHYVMQIYVFY